ncbi:helix-turn-helix transcriptional regulator [Bdellovibrionota bacterium FG-2]
MSFARFAPEVGNQSLSASNWSGPLLKVIREERGLSLDDVGTGTKIRTAVLEVIEQEDRSKLPAPAYIRALVLQLAKFLNLPAEQVVKGYLEHLERTTGSNQCKKQTLSIRARLGKQEFLNRDFIDVLSME